MEVKHGIAPTDVFPIMTVQLTTDLQIVQSVLVTSVLYQNISAKTRDYELLKIHGIR